MLFGLLRALARIRVTVAYAVILTGVTTALMTLGPQAQNRVISHASTNLHNLSHGHLGTLFVSAFVIDAGPIYVWLPGLMCLLALAELMWRSGRLVVAFAVGHIGATLLVAVGLTAAVELGWMSTDVTRATDVGMSYGASAVLGSFRRRSRGGGGPHGPAGGSRSPSRWSPSEGTSPTSATRWRWCSACSSRPASAGPARWTPGAVSAARRRVGLRISDAGQQRPDVDRGDRARHLGCRPRRGRGGTATRPRRSASSRRPFVRADARCRVTPLSSGDHL